MRRTRLLSGAISIICYSLFLASFQSHAQVSPRTDGQTASVLGQPLPGITDSQKADFEQGLLKFSEVETPTDGLGPVFNGTACAECHKAGAIGGAGTDLTTARVTRIGGMINQVYTDLADSGGPVLEARSIREFYPTCPIAGEGVPPQAQFVSHRITTPLFGAGLMEAIPDTTILQRTHLSDPDGVQGVANMVFNPETHQIEVGRFGWKAQVSSLHFFAGDAYLNEMGAISTSFPNKNLPQGKPIPTGWDTGGDIAENDRDITSFTNFMQLLAPPDPRLPTSPQAQAGQAVFASLRCGQCHVPMMMTGPNLAPALSNQPVRLYSDLLLHRMGPYLADGIRQGNAAGDQFRTAPLWGLSRRSFYLHDGRALSLTDAIMGHGGEAVAARSRFQALRPPERANLLAFLSSL